MPFPLKTALAFILTLLAVAACSGGGTAADRGQTVVEGYQVSWNQVKMSSGPRGGGSPLLFHFRSVSAAAAAGTGVTEQHWENEARKQGSTVHTMKILLGKDVYPTRDGGVASCSYFAQEKGLCGQRLGLPVAERARLAQRALQGGSRCRWTGFDPAYNRAMSYSAGAANDTLWVRADCR